MPMRSTERCRRKSIEDRPKTLNGRLMLGGWVPIAFIKSDKKMSRDLVELALDISEGKYADIRFVHSDEAFEGQNLQVREAGHVVYAWYERRQKKPNGFIMPGFYDSESGDDFSTTPIRSIY